ncbi:Aste57867_15169 [Aphanomyces stellatus]|uniref:Aste57867_15169 protein n=1 Tax=Aphanomyces stellatus TaxID=120398 RepID=A0A485L3H4_9STRA|nr:hypothetical protein As57867_015113 [Aphanomyces stellatus]VFT91978.1 Aste57867_15169 [Aphanomyces stellatus]
MAKDLTDKCHFNGCSESVRPGSRKCAFHRKKGICRIHNCHNQVYARGLCVRHGARKPCTHPKCDGYARNGGFCTRHGEKNPIKLCSVKDCTNKAHARQLCVRHGGGQKCKASDCTMHARTGGWCSRHTPVEDLDHFRHAMETMSTAAARAHQPFLALQPRGIESGFSMHDICQVLSQTYGLPAPVNLSLAQSQTAKLPSIKLSADSKPYFIVHDDDDDDRDVGNAARMRDNNDAEYDSSDGYD